MAEMHITSSTARMAGEFVFMLALAQIGICQTASAQEGETASSDTVEEIIVYGDKSLTRLRHEFYGAEEDFFDAFNELNSNDEFDVDCDYVSFLGDRRRHHLCMPKFATKADADATLSMILGGKLDCAIICDGNWADYTDNSAWVKKKNEQLRNELADLIGEQPMLQEALTELVKAKRVYESARKKR